MGGKILGPEGNLIPKGSVARINFKFCKNLNFGMLAQKVPGLNPEILLRGTIRELGPRGGTIPIFGNLGREVSLGTTKTGRGAKGASRGESIHTKKGHIFPAKIRGG